MNTERSSNFARTERFVATLLPNASNSEGSRFPPTQLFNPQLLAYLRNFEYGFDLEVKTSLDPKHFDALRRFKAGIFKVLAHPTRIHIIETLRSAELPVGAILEKVQVEQANLSQHLSVLRQSHLVTTRKKANQVLYSLRDPLLVDVLDAMRKYFQKHFEDSIQMLRGMENVD